MLKINDEFSELKSELAIRYSHSRTQYETHNGTNLDEEASKFIYFWVRLSKPKNVLETGVANGESTYYLLNAITKNGNGVLYSTDISSKVGNLLSETERNNWTLIVLNRGNKKKQFTSVLNDIGNINLFLHDSDHSYGWQRFEYNCVLNHLDRKNSLLVSDDVDYSYAFLEFATEINSKPSFIIGKGKVLGILEFKS